MFRFHYIFVIFIVFCMSRAKIPCDPESFKFIDPQSILKYDRPYLFSIQNHKEIGCAINATYLWEVLRLRNNTYIKLNESLLEVEGYTKNAQNNLDFTNLSRKRDIFGDEFGLRVSLIPPPTFYPSFRIHHVKILLEEYNFHIAGGSRRIHYVGTGDIWMNATANRETKRPFYYETIKWECEPPFRAPVDQVLNWKIMEFNLRTNVTHLCKVEVTIPVTGRRLTADQLIEIRPMDQRPILEVVCVENCARTDPLNDTVLKYICYSNCIDNVTWMFLPYSNELQKLLKFPKDRNDTVIIPGGSFNHGTHFKIVATMGDIAANYTIANYDLTDEMDIDCIKNCYYRQYEIVFKVKCLVPCEGIKFHWESFPYPKVWNWSYFDYRVDNDRLTFAPNSLPPKSKIHISVKNKNMFAATNFTTIQLYPTLHIKCIPTCSPADELLPLEIDINCTQYCDLIEYYIWILDPPLEEFHWYDHTLNSNRTLVIPPFSYKANSTIIAKVIVESTGFPYTIQFEYGRSFNLQILCIRNCRNKSDNSYSLITRPIILKLNCFVRCLKNISYNWYISPEPIDPFLTIEPLDNGTGLYIPANIYPITQKTADVTVRFKHYAANFTIEFTSKDPEISIYCLKNCFEQAAPNEDVVLQVVCKAHCDDLMYSWHLDPQKDPFFWHSKIEVSSRNQTLTIKRNAYYENDSVTVVAECKPYSVKAAFNVRFRRVEPVLNLKCIENCEAWVRLDVILEVECLENCVEEPFEWAIHPEPVGYDWVLKKNNSQLVITPGNFLPNAHVKVEAMLRNAITSLLLVFKNLSPVLSLSCEPRPCNKTQNRKEKVSVTVSCLERCIMGNYRWTLHPVEQNFPYDKHVIKIPTGTTMTILPNTFHHLDNITVTAFESRDNISTNLRFREPEPEFFVKCTDNCNFSNPHEPVHLEVTCLWLCHYIDIYQWEFHPAPNDVRYDMIMSPRHRTVTIKQHIYKDGDIINVTVYWSVYGSSIILAFVEPPPELEIKCLRNKEYNLLKQTVFEVFCHANCSGQQPYNWTIVPIKGNITFYNDNKALSIHPESYFNKDKLNLTVCKGKGCALSLTIFSYPPYDLKLECLRNCDKNGRAIPSFPLSFKVSCLKNCDINMSFEWTIRPAPQRFIKNLDFVVIHRNRTFETRPYLFANESCATVFCRSGEVTVSKFICFIQPTPQVQILCERNCGYPNPAYLTLFNVTCFNNCISMVYNWKVSPSKKLGSTFHYLRNTRLAIKPFTYHDGDHVEIVVTFGSLKIKKEIVFAEKPPVFKLLCRPNCTHADPRNDITIAIKCIKMCKRATFFWVVNPTLPGFIWSLNISMGNDNRSLTIKSGTYTNESVVNVVALSKKYSSATKTIQFYVKSPKLIITCEENCKYNPMYIVKLDISCHGECSQMSSALECNIDPMANEAEDFYYNISGIYIVKNAYGSDTEVKVTCSLLRSETTFVFSYKIPPWNGTCAIDPLVGVSGETEFTLECVDFSSNANYYVYQYVPDLSLGVGMKLYHSTSPHCSGILLGPDLKAVIVVDVAERWRTFKRIYLSATSYYFFDINYEHNNDNTEVEDELPWDRKQDRKVLEKYYRFKQLLTEGLFTTALQLAFVIDRHLNLAPTSVANHIRKDLLKNTLTAVDDFDCFQLLFFVEVVQTESVYTLSTLCLSMEIVSKISQRLGTWKDVSTKYDRHTLKLSARIIFMISVSIVNKVQGLVENLLLEDIPHSENLFVDYSDLDARVETAEAMLHTKHVTIDAIRAVKFAANLFLNPSETSMFETDEICLVIRRLSTKHMQLIQLHIDKSFVEFIPYGFKSQQMGHLNITFKLIRFVINPFWWDSRIVVSDGYVISFTAENVNLSTIQGPFRIGVQLKEDISYVSEQVVMKPEDYLIWEVIIPINFTFKLFIAEGDARVSLSFHRPERHFTKIKGKQMSSAEAVYFKVKQTPFYLGLLATGEVELKFVGLTCMAWHGKTWEWDLNGCEVAAENLKGDRLILCSCKQQSLFTARTAEPRYHRILDDRDLDLEEWPRNLTLFIFLGLICALFFIFLIIALIKDLIYSKRRKFIILPDNSEDGNEIYLVSVQTGLWPRSGTTARVAIKMAGQDRTSKVHVLNILEKKYLQRNSLDCFLIYQPAPLGDIKRLTIWHDCYGKRPEWFCDRVVITHLRSGHRDQFEICRWFSLTRPPYTTIGTFNPLSVGHTETFCHKLKESMRDNFSLVTLPFYRRTHTNWTTNAVMSAISVLSLLTTVLCLVESDQRGWVTFEVVLVSVIVGFTISVLLEIIFRKGR